MICWVTGKSKERWGAEGEGVKRERKREGVTYSLLLIFHSNCWLLIYIKKKELGGELDPAMWLSADPSARPFIYLLFIYQWGFLFSIKNAFCSNGTGWNDLKLIFDTQILEWNSQYRRRTEWIVPRSEGRIDLPDNNMAKRPFSSSSSSSSASCCWMDVKQPKFHKNLIAAKDNRNGPVKLPSVSMY